MRSFARYLLRSNRFELYAIVIVCRFVYVCMRLNLFTHHPNWVPCTGCLLCCDSSRVLILIYFSFSFDYVGLFQNDSRNTFQKHSQYLHLVFGVAMYLCQKHKTYIKNYCFLLSELSCGDNFVSHFASENLPCSYIASYRSSFQAILWKIHWKQ